MVGRITLLIFLSFCFLASGRAQSSPKNIQQITVADTYPQAMRLWSNGDEDGAETLLKAAYKTNPQNIKIAFFYAICLRNRFAFKEAIPVLEALARNPASNRYEVQFARHLADFQAKRDRKSALASMTAIAQQHPQDVLPLWTVQVIAHQYQESRKDVQDGIALCRLLMKRIQGTGPVRLRYHYANYLSTNGDLKEALVERRRTVALKETWWTLEGLANTLAQAGNYDGALTVFARASKLQPDRWRFWFNWIQCCREAQEYEEGIVHCVGAMHQKYNHPAIFYEWGLCLFELNQLEEALEKFREGAKRQPGNFTFYEEMARIYDIANQADTARKMREIAAKLKRKNPNPWGNIL